ncbi:MAG: hypothetical protein OXH57_12995 [Ekhidna sp.]|nr:hypothetical protein [Ekhidna sp.]
MNLQAEKLRLIELLLNTNNPSIIERIRSILQTEEANDIWEEITDKQKDEVENALKEVEEGTLVSFEQFLEKHK